MSDVISDVEYCCKTEDEVVETVCRNPLQLDADSYFSLIIPGLTDKNLIYRSPPHPHTYMLMLIIL